MAQGASLPAAPSRTPGLPENAIFYDFQGWNGIDTKPPRPGIEDDKSAWCDNLMPLGPHNLRAMPDRGPTAYTAPGGNPIIDYDSYGLSSTIIDNGPHFIIFLQDGSAVDYAIFPATTAPIAPAGTFLPPAETSIGVRQYGTNLLTIATEQGFNAFWAWDGANLYGSGTLGPEVTILDGGRNYTSLPTIVARGGSGTGATFTSTISGDAIATVTPTSPGTGYLPTDSQTILLTFSGGGGPTSAYGAAGAVNGAITGVNILSGGSAFTSVPGINITDAGGGTGAQAVVTGISGGTITAITMIDCGQNYVTPVFHTVGGGGSGLNATAVLNNGVINSVSITDGGGPYLNAPQVMFLGPEGSGAQATAIIDSSGAVTGVDFGHGPGAGFTGTGYSGGAVVGFSGGGVASATIRLMPFGIHGHSIESYQGRIWVTTTLQGTKTFGTAPGSATNFSPGDGGFVFPATDSTLRYQWSALRQSNGFLYLVGDSSVNYVSGVTTSGTPATTTFSNLNVDPQIGSPWTPSVDVYSRAVIIASNFGIHAIYGGAVQKISTPLDGIYDTGAIDPNNPPSTAIAEIFGVHVMMVLNPIIDPVSGLARNALLVWDGKRWWTASQSTALSKIRTMEWGSLIQAWGTDNLTLFPMFQRTSTLPKTLRSKLWIRPGIHVQKRAMQLYALWLAATDTTLAFNIDNENVQAGVTQGPFTQSAGLIGWARSACPDNIGICVGFTMQSTSGDFTLIDATILAQEWKLFV